MAKMTCVSCGHVIHYLEESPFESLSCPACGESLRGKSRRHGAADRSAPARAGNGHLISIMTVLTPEEAELARSRLEAEGIAAYPEGTYAAGTLFVTLAQVRLQVREDDAPQATALLRSAAYSPERDDGEWDPLQRAGADPKGEAEDAGDGNEPDSPGPAKTVITLGKSLIWFWLALVAILFTLGALGSVASSFRP